MRESVPKEMDSAPKIEAQHCPPASTYMCNNTIVYIHYCVHAISHKNISIHRKLILLHF